MVKLVKQLAIMAARNPALVKLVDLLEARGDRRQNLLRVLTYHRVAPLDERPELCPALISATPETFRRQMEHLAARYRAVSINDVLRAARGGEPLPPRAVLITFDDAYRDFAEHAWPVLRGLGLPAALFVATDYPDHPRRGFWWDRLYHALCATTARSLAAPIGELPLADPAARRQAYDRLKVYVKELPHDDAMRLVDKLCQRLDVAPAPGAVLCWAELRELAQQGLALGAHTRSHPLLNRVSLARARAEALGSLDDLRHRLGSAPPIFAYPSGGWDQDVVRALRESGFELAFTTGRGVNDLSTADPLRLLRINVGQRTSLVLLRAQLLACSRRGGGRRA